MVCGAQGWLYWRREGLGRGEGTEGRERREGTGGGRGGGRGDREEEEERGEGEVGGRGERGEEGRRGFQTESAKNKLRYFLPLADGCPPQTKAQGHIVDTSAAETRANILCREKKTKDVKWIPSAHAVSV